MVRAWSRLLGGHVREVDAEAEGRYAAAVRERADCPRARWYLMRGLVGAIRGSPRYAISALHEGVAVTGADDRGWPRPMHVLLAMATALAGDIAAAEDNERRADEANRSIDGLFGVDAARSRAWVLAVRGELTAAADQARRAGELAVAHEQWAFEALALHDLARSPQEQLAKPRGGDPVPGRGGGAKCKIEGSKPVCGRRGPLPHRGLQRQHIEGAHPVALAGEAQAAEILRRDEISHFVVGRFVDEDLTRAGRRL